MQVPGRCPAVPVWSSVVVETCMLGTETVRWTRPKTGIVADLRPRTSCDTSIGSHLHRRELLGLRLSRLHLQWVVHK